MVWYSGPTAIATSPALCLPYSDQPPRLSFAVSCAVVGIGTKEDSLNLVSAVLPIVLGTWPPSNAGLVCGRDHKCAYRLSNTSVPGL